MDSASTIDDFETWLNQLMEQPMIDALGTLSGSVSSVPSINQQHPSVDVYPEGDPDLTFLGL
jgi:hypothetical protein